MPNSLTRPFRVLALLFSGLFAWPELAQAQEDDFEKRVRAYLLANPEVILEALEVLSSREAKSQLTAKIEAHEGLFADTPSIGIGPADAPLRVVEFFDYRCAPCKALHPKLEAALDGHNQLRVEMRHLPILSPGSERGARFALAVKALGSAETYDAVHAQLWALRGPLNAQTFRRISQEVGMDWDQIEPMMQSDAITKRIGINRDIAIDLEIWGTPAFVTPNSVSFGDTDADALVQGWLDN